jgi:hypothetical protein
MGSTPISAVLLSSFLALVLLKLAVFRMLATPSTAAQSVKEDARMSKRVSNGLLQHLRQFMGWGQAAGRVVC